MSAVAKYIAIVLAFAIAIQSIYTAGFGLFDPLVHRPIILIAALGVAIFRWSLVRHYNVEQRHLKVLCWVGDLIMFAIAAAPVFRYIQLGETLEEDLIFLGFDDQLLGLGAMLVIMEMTRRVVGPPVFVLTALALIYMLFGKYLPGFLGNAGYSLERVVSDIWLSTIGVMGTAFGVLLNLVLVFIVFGAVLSRTGAGEALIKIAFALTGRMRGGPAHGAVIASMAFGTMSGSTVANVVGTGSFTIPLIKRRGFTPRFSGAVEAAASTGGQFTPPVMGSAAFLLADLADIPYILVALGALVPALFFYLSIFLAVELESARLGIQPTAKDERTKLSGKDWLDGLMFMGPILVIVFMMVIGRSPAFAGFSAIIATVILAFILNPEFRKDLKILGPTLVEGGTNATQILIIIACIGIFIGVIDATGIGIKLAQVISSTSDEQLFWALVVKAIAATFLSMGMPTTPAYLIVVLTMGPVIAKLDAPLFSMHMFILYYAVLGAVTPPVASASYTAAPIAGDDPVKLSFTAVRLTFVAYVMPFVFIFDPSILLITEEFTWAGLFSIGIRLAISMYLCTAGLAGFAGQSIGWGLRSVYVVLGLLALMTNPVIHWIAAIAGAGLAISVLMKSRRHGQSQAAE